MEFERLGAFYLGKEYDLGAGKMSERPFMYDARDLCTHALCVGMTGSGKTGLCIDLLEEAAIDRVPALILDPKGDITNLLLQFPDLSPEQFRPWIDEEEAQREGLSPDEFAAVQSRKWDAGLRQWGQMKSRISLLRKSADFRIFTPGSSAGIPVSILQSFAPPSVSRDFEADQLREEIGAVVSGLLGLINIDADPLRSREHILLASILEHNWRQGVPQDLGGIISATVKPPLKQVGVFDLETFFPEKDRFELAVRLNNILAAPTFSAWLEGQPLSVPGFLATPDGMPRHSIFSIAHLSDAERTFFVTLLLNQVISWMRTQPGSGGLKAILYMDEVFGFFPPIAEPASKKPMLTLLKQARAFGVGVVLATQNPADLDYKGLGNVGTWFIGRLQTERDKARLLEGLRTASPDLDRSFSEGRLTETLSQLPKRVFLVRNIHEEGITALQTRWALSYLRGPLTRSQIQQLKESRGWQPEGGSSLPPADTGVTRPVVGPEVAGPASVGRAEQENAVTSSPPHLAPGIRQYFQRSPIGAGMPAEGVGRGGGALLHRPAAWGRGRIYFSDRGRDVNESRDFSVAIWLGGSSDAQRWEEAFQVESEPELSVDPGAGFLPLPEWANEARELKGLEDGLADHIYRTSAVTLFHSPALKEYSRVGEEIRDFKVRISYAARDERDHQVDKLRQQYDKKLRILGDRLDQYKLEMLKKRAGAKSRKGEFIVSVGESFLGMFMGRKAYRAASSSIRGYRMSSAADLAAEAAEEKVKGIETEIAELSKELEARVEEIKASWDESLERVEEVKITPGRDDIKVERFGILWIPERV